MTDKIPLVLFTAVENERFVETVLSQLGQPYIWPCPENNYSGKGLPHSDFPMGRDCSGTVTWAIYKVTNGRLDWRATHNAKKLCDNSFRIELESVKPGDLVFYGKSKNLITHVMTVTKVEDGKIHVTGASGGGAKTTTPRMAAIMKASVKTYDKYNYRKDFVTFGRLMKNFYD